VNADTKHPDLLIVDESTWLVVKSILTKRSAEIILHLGNTCLMHVQNVVFLGFIIGINI